MGTFDFVIVTTSGDNVPWTELLLSLAPNGKIIALGAFRKPVELPILLLIAGQKSLCGSIIGSAAMQRRMLRFAALHQIRPQIEEFKFEQVNEGIQHVRDGKATFRVVLKR